MKLRLENLPMLSGGVAALVIALVCFLGAAQYARIDLIILGFYAFIWGIMIIQLFVQYEDHGLTPFC